MHTTAHERFAKHLSDLSEQQKRVQMAGAAVSNVVNQEIIERNLRQLYLQTGASGLHVFKQIALSPSARPTTIYLLLLLPFQMFASALPATSLYL